MLTYLPELSALPRQTASQVKNRWGEIVRLVRQSGSVAITNHALVEMVVLDAATYQELTLEVQALKAREHSALEELTGRFDQRLALLQQPAAADGVQSLLRAGGRLEHRAKAGTSY